MTDFFKTIDIFGKNIQLNLNGKTHVKTVSGGIMTIFMAIACFYAFWELGREIFEKKTPIVYKDQRFIDIAQDPVILKPNNFPFAVSIMKITDDGEYQIFDDPTIFKVAMQQRYFIKFENKTNIDKFKEIQVEKCTEKHFDLDDVNEYFTKLEGFDQQKYYCPKQGQDIQIQGEFGQQIFDTLQIFLMKCDPKRDKNVQCKSDEEIDRVLRQIYFDIFIPEVILTLGERQKPFRYRGKNVFTVVSSSMRKYGFMKLDYTNIKTDVGMLGEDLEEDLVLKYKEYNEFSNYYDKDSKSKIDESLYEKSVRYTNIYEQDSLYYLEVSISPNVQDTYIRRYKKLSILCAEMGGIFKFVIIIGLVLNRPFSDVAFRQELFNTLYLLEKKKKKRTSFMEDDNYNNILGNRYTGMNISNKHHMNLSNKYQFHSNLHRDSQGSSGKRDTNIDYKDAIQESSNSKKDHQGYLTYFDTLKLSLILTLGIKQDSEKRKKLVEIIKQVNDCCNIGKLLKSIKQFERIRDRLFTNEGTKTILEGFDSESSSRNQSTYSKSPLRKKNFTFNQKQTFIQSEVKQECSVIFEQKIGESRFQSEHKKEQESQTPNNIPAFSGITSSDKLIKNNYEQGNDVLIQSEQRQKISTISQDCASNQLQGNSGVLYSNQQKDSLMWIHNSGSSQGNFSFTNNNQNSIRQNQVSIGKNSQFKRQQKDIYERTDLPDTDEIQEGQQIENELQENENEIEQEELQQKNKNKKKKVQCLEDFDQEQQSESNLENVASPIYKSCKVDFKIFSPRNEKQKLIRSENNTYNNNEKFDSSNTIIKESQESYQFFSPKSSESQRIQLFKSETPLENTNFQMINSTANKRSKQNTTSILSNFHLNSEKDLKFNSKQQSNTDIEDKKQQNQDIDEENKNDCIHYSKDQCQNSIPEELTNVNKTSRKEQGTMYLKNYLDSSKLLSSKKY